MEGNKHCSLCTNELADHICICSNLPPLGPNCQAIHQSKPGFHFSFPIEALDYVNAKNAQKVRVRVFSLLNSHEILRGNLQKVAKFKEEIEAAYGNMYREMEEGKRKIMQKLDEMQEELSRHVEKTIEETSKYPYKEDYQPSSGLADLVWSHCCQDSSEPIAVFTCEVGNTDKRLLDPLEISIKASLSEFAKWNYESGGANIKKSIAASSELIDLYSKGQAPATSLLSSTEQIFPPELDEAPFTRSSAGPLGARLPTEPSKFSKIGPPPGIGSALFPTEPPKYGAIGPPPGICLKYGAPHEFGKIAPPPEIGPALLPTEPAKFGKYGPPPGIGPKFGASPSK